jgi:hypothetical protein
MNLSNHDGTVLNIKSLLYDLAVAVLAILRSKTNAFPLSTVVIEQYRPPIDKYIIGTICRCPLVARWSISHLCQSL